MTWAQTRFFSVTLVLAAAAGSASAHHGTNISYDHDRPLTISGTVTEFVWRNPHAQLYLEVKDARGVAQKWASELNSPSVLRRQGWTRESFKPGDAITLTVFPAKSGATVGVVDRTKAILVGDKEVIRPLARNVD
jgi:hypothetical protein